MQQSHSHSDVRLPRHPPFEIFRVFSLISLMGFGGVLPFAYHSLVERYRWMSAAEFGQALGVCQILPGPTICNLAIAVGHDNGGAKGAAAAVLGLIAAPFAIVLALGVAYQHFGELAVVQNALKGMIAVAAGLIFATGLKIAAQMLKDHEPAGVQATRVAFVALAFVGLGILRWPLITVVCILAPAGTLLFRVWPRR